MSTRPPVELKGRPASRGIFAGPIVRIGPVGRGRQHSGSADIERAALESAVLSAIGELAGLAQTLKDEGADMLAFQIAMLEDDSLKEPALAAIDEGSSASDAWAAALDAEIAGYQLSDEEYFRARAADLKDLRDRVLRQLSGSSAPKRQGGAVLAGEDVPPTLFLETNWTEGGAIALTGGSPSSHVAMLARARGVPMVVGLGKIEINGHETAIVDGESGTVVLSPPEEALREGAAKAQQFGQSVAREREYLGRPATTSDGVRIDVLVNVSGVDELDHIDIASCDGIGLMRTEFLFRDGAPLPDEDEQHRAYRRFLEWAGGKPVIIRTLDIGGDKPIRGLTPEGETNPFLGLRGIRLMLARRDVFAMQLRALARAAPHGNLKIMLPMVTVPSEIEDARQMLGQVIEDLVATGVPAAMPLLGIMVEVPAVAIVPELFARADFFSIGSNDLTQYVTAASRDSTSVAGLNDPGHPAVLKLISAVAEFGREHAIPVSLCGDMASDPAHIGALLEAGLRSLSVAPAALGSVKAAIAASLAQS